MTWFQKNHSCYFEYTYLFMDGGRRGGGGGGGNM